MDFNGKGAADWCSGQFQEQFVRDYFGTEPNKMDVPKALIRVSNRSSNTGKASDTFHVEERQSKDSNNNHKEKKKKRRSFFAKESNQSVTFKSMQKMGIEERQIGKTSPESESADVVKSRKRNGSKVKRKPSQLLKSWLPSKYHNSDEMNCNSVDEKTELMGKSLNRESITTANSEERIGSKLKRKHSQFQKFFPYKRRYCNLKKTFRVTNSDKKFNDTLALEKSKLKKEGSDTTKNNTEKTDIEEYVIDDDDDDNHSNKVEKHEGDKVECVAAYSSGKRRRTGFLNKLKNTQTAGRNICEHNPCKSDLQKTNSTKKCKTKSTYPFEKTRLKNSISTLEDDVEVYEIDDDNDVEVYEIDDDDVEVYEIDDDHVEVYEIDDDHDDGTEEENQEAECIAIHGNRKGKETGVFKKLKRMKSEHCGNDNMPKQDKGKFKSTSPFGKTTPEKKYSISPKKRGSEGEPEVFEIDCDHDRNHEDQAAECIVMHTDMKGNQTGVFKKLKMNEQRNSDTHKLDKGKSSSPETAESSAKCSGSIGINLVQRKQTRRSKKKRKSTVSCANGKGEHISQKSPESTCSLKNTVCSRDEKSEADSSEQEESEGSTRASDSMLVGHKASKRGRQLNLTSLSKSVRSNILKERIKMTLQPAKFRMLNEMLYSRTGGEAMKYFQSNRDAFSDYHQGYELQVSKWPVNPVDLIIRDLEKMPKEHIIADLGCGSAKIAQTFRNRKVYSYDLVAINEYVKSYDISKLPLQASSVNIVVFCLSLMGTNIKDYILEANRILKDDGMMKIAEVESRIDNVGSFIKGIEAFGFCLIKKDVSCKMFVLLDFRKARKKLKPGKLPNIVLSPCLYKKR